MKYFEHLSNKIWTKTTQVVFFSIGLFQTTHFKNTLESFSKCFRIKWFKSVFFRITLWRVTEYILFFLKFSSKQSGFSNLISLWSFRNKILLKFLWISVFKLKPWVKQFKSNCFLLNEQKSLSKFQSKLLKRLKYNFLLILFEILCYLNTLFKSNLILWRNTFEIKFRIPTLENEKTSLNPFWT